MLRPTPSAPLPSGVRLCAGVALAVLGCRTGLYDANGVEIHGIDAAVPGDPLSDAAVADLDVPRDLVLPPGHCGLYTIKTTRVVRADLLIVQDRSQSMSQGSRGERFPPPGQSKWDHVTGAINLVVERAADVDWGLMLFGTAVRCQAPVKPDVPVGPGNAVAVRNTLRGAILSSGTPTAAAIRSATAWYGTLRDDQPHFLLVATDGQPTCGSGGGNDSVATVAAVTAAASAGIKTFVVGIGSTDEADDTLDAMAHAGGVPNTTPGQPAHYTVSSGPDLVRVLEAAALRITPCSYPLEREPPDRSLVTIVGPQGTIPRDPLRQSGWDYSDDGVSVVFHGDACAQLRQGAVTQVEAVYACPDR